MAADGDAVRNPGATAEDDTPTPENCWKGPSGHVHLLLWTSQTKQIGVVVVLPPPTARVSVATACLQ
jgi:hypothetical protein